MIMIDRSSAVKSAAARNEPEKGTVMNEGGMAVACITTTTPMIFIVCSSE